MIQIIGISAPKNHGRFRECLLLGTLEPGKICGLLEHFDPSAWNKFQNPILKVFCGNANKISDLAAQNRALLEVGDIEPVIHNVEDVVKTSCLQASFRDRLSSKRATKRKNPADVTPLSRPKTPGGQRAG